MTMVEFKAWMDAGSPVTLADGTKAWLGCLVSWGPARDGGVLVVGHDPTPPAIPIYGSNIGRAPFEAMAIAKPAEVELDFSGVKRPPEECYKEFAKWAVKWELEQ